MVPTLISQNDPRWQGLLIPPSKQTLGRAGCLISDLSSATSAYGTFFTPAQLAQMLKYTPDGRLLWQSLADNPEIAFKLEKRLYNFDPVEINKSLADENRFVFLNVNNNSHWVFAWRKDLLFGGSYIVADPYPFPAVRKSTRSFRNITGSAHFILKNPKGI